eukprot:c2423_g1_i1.p1 GENE.c2423_g1_i1~~c2423_g1_i1.p1  ORF type:complete len:119 (+),score=16.63 c2423_g1_i1:36-359(+)
MLNTGELNDAAGAGKVDLVEQLLAAGHDVNGIVGYYNWTPLHNAIHWSRIHVCVTLINHGADLSLPDRSGMIPLELAVHGKRDTVLITFLAVALLLYGPAQSSWAIE